ncbi:hypothetical protein SEA_SKOG_38 [Gordonia phage Skog]|uniref:Uncharacterized protein n=1 Tax=Gordonia phage Skog TaxID=2704033 RepID=A0A6G6XK99_9CAUD|nr:hypothetical protein KHQ85_gp038 [Gordonia phage Skog]QIG58190.1 hypothetical protein SEA_SKOG_38 [Gordonia phage Skog]
MSEYTPPSPHLSPNGVRVSYNLRGFQVYGEPVVTRVYGDTVRIYQSSIAGEGPHAWLDVTEGQTKRSVMAHLSLDEAIGVRDLLDAFISVSEHGGVV